MDVGSDEWAAALEHATLDFVARANAARVAAVRLSHARRALAELLAGCQVGDRIEWRGARKGGTGTVQEIVLEDPAEGVPTVSDLCLVVRADKGGRENVRAPMAWRRVAA